MSRFARLGRALVVALAFAFAVLVVVSYRKPGARTEGAKDPVAETLLAEANGARDRMRFRDFQYDETRESEGRYRVTASEAVRFEEKGGRLFRLKDVVFESRESKEGRSVSIRAPRAELAEGSRAFRVFDGVEVAGEEMRVTGESFRYDPARRLLASEGPVDATRGGLVANASVRLHRHARRASSSSTETRASGAGGTGAGPSSCAPRKSSSGATGGSRRAAAPS